MNHRTGHSEATPSGVSSPRPLSDAATSFKPRDCKWQYRKDRTHPLLKNTTPAKKGRLDNCPFSLREQKATGVSRGSISRSVVFGRRRNARGHQ